LLKYAQAETKVYSGRVKFGVATDSLDADGAVVATVPVPALTVELVNEATAAMMGPQQQTPPMVSALKRDGVRLHQLARQGIEVEREPRNIVIDQFDLVPTEHPDEWTFVVKCSVGTYIRVLLVDLAAKLDTLAHLTALRREQSGTHSVSEALPLNEVLARVARGEIVLEPPLSFVADLERFTASPEQISKLRKGQRIVVSESFTGTEVAALDEHGDFFGTIEPLGEFWKPKLMLAAPGESLQ
jgi:tRNA pseudouridine55 synthase